VVRVKEENDDGACLWSDEVRTYTVVWSDEEKENEESG
jgi:hypothetical protein